MDNLLDLLKGSLGQTVVKQIGSYLGESQGNTQSALDGILPSILGSVIKGATGSNSGANSIIDMLTSGGHDGSLLDNLGGMVSGGGKDLDNVLGSGGGILDSLIGDKLGPLGDIISGVSGIGKGSAGSLMKLAGPVIMGIIGRKLRGGGGLNVGSLLSLLSGQKKSVSAGLPAGVSDLLGLGSALKANATTTTQRATTKTTHEEPKSSNGWMKWLPLLLIAALAFYFLRGCNADPVGAVGDAVTNTVETAGDAAGAVADATGDAVGSVVDATGNAISKVGDLSSDFLASIKGTVSGELADFLGDANADLSKVFTFDRLNFNSGSAALTEDSAEQVGQLAKIMDNYPGLKIHVRGHTDNTGNAEANMNLSTERAKSVKAALVALGTSADRVSVEGRGINDPTATNDTDAGRAANRRIDFQVTAR